jgi:hypothetical protein
MLNILLKSTVVYNFTNNLTSEVCMTIALCDTNGKKLKLTEMEWFIGA